MTPKKKMGKNHLRCHRNPQRSSQMRNTSHYSAWKPIFWKRTVKAALPREHPKVSGSVWWGCALTHA